MVEARILNHNLSQNCGDAISMRYFIAAIFISFTIMASINFETNGKVLPLPNQILKINLFALEKFSPQSTVQKTEIIKKERQQKFIDNHHAHSNFNEEKIERKELLKKQMAQNSIPTSGIGQETAKIIHQANYKLQTPVQYPNTALNQGWQGIVTLHVEVLKDGLVKDIKIAQTSGYVILDKAALRAVQKWQFNPTVIDGKAINSLVEVPVRFTINQS